MNKRSFLKRVLMGAAGTALGTSVQSKEAPSKEGSEASTIIGFNHLPNKEITTMKTVLHTSDSRGLANHGWLESRHTFSFANYYNPDRLNFGALRVLNDDRVSGGKGFGRHPHDNMEIISIPLEGDLEHQDSMGNKAIIRNGDVQVMSAGTGVFHSEYNKHPDQEVKFLQIWMFPNRKNVTPRYDQISIADIRKENAFYQILSPSADDEGVWVNQEAWFHIGEFEAGKSDSYALKGSKHGVYAFILEGSVTIAGQELNERDGFGIWDVKKITVKADSKTKILLMEVPMMD